MGRPSARQGDSVLVDVCLFGWRYVPVRACAVRRKHAIRRVRVFGRPRIIGRRCVFERGRVFARE
eukprot:8801545-Lingulodinium_polyedra.AAC.1